MRVFDLNQNAYILDDRLSSTKYSSPSNTDKLILSSDLSTFIYDYYKKSETSSAVEINNSFQKYKNDLTAAENRLSIYSEDLATNVKKDIPLSVSQLSNDVGYVKENDLSVTYLSSTGDLTISTKNRNITINIQSGSKTSIRTWED